MATQQQHRILIYVTCYNVLDGVTLTLRKVEQELLAAGHAVCILTTVSGDPAYTHLDGEHPNRQILFLDNSIPIPFLTDPNNPALSYEMGFAISSGILRKIDDFEPTLIHVAVPDCTALHVVQYARNKEIPLMGTYHSNIPEYMDHYPGLSWLKHILWGFFRHQYNFYQGLFVPTPFIQNFLAQTQKMDQITDLHVWGRGVDVERFHPQHRDMMFRRDLGIADSEVVLCWCGRLVPEKRVDIFCDTVRRLHKLGLPFKALVVGAGPCEDEVKKLPNTVFAGWLNADELATAYASSDVFLFPSSVETFGNVTLEAMASGLPVVVEAGCSGHLVHEDENGFACAAGDGEAFFEATRQLVVDPVLRTAYSQRSRQISLGLEKRAVVQQMLSHYSKITDDFYKVYGGRHANRDAAYCNPDSFRAGNLPRPVLLVLVEWLFVVVFRVIWNLTHGFFVMQRALLNNSLVGSPAGSPLRNSSPKRTNKRASFEPKKRPLQAASSSPIRPAASPSIVEMRDVKLHEQDPLRPSSSEEDDGDTNTTVSSENDSHQQATTNRGEPQRRACGDARIFHLLSIAFIRSMEMICRTESLVRNACSCRGGQLTIFVSRKRKRSADAESEEDLSFDGGQEGHTGGGGRRRNPQATPMLVV